MKATDFIKMIDATKAAEPWKELYANYGKTEPKKK